MDIKKAAEDAIFVQSACNLSGVVKSFAEAMDAIWEVAHKIGKGTDWVNRHPIARLFTEQIGYLNCVFIKDTIIEKRDYYKAYEMCEKLAKGEDVEIPDYN